MEKTQERVIVSVGGSLIVPDGIDTNFLSKFKALIDEKVRKGFSFYIIAGGGKLSRRYQENAEQIHGDLSREDLDWLGIHATRLNAHLLRTVFRENAYKRVEKNPTRASESDEPIIVGAGWKPGWSTDYCAVLAAKSLGARHVVNLSNIDYVYDTDPRTNPDAQKIEKISWTEFRKLIPSEWDPGLSSPFDPVAAREAEEAGIEVAIINGANLERFSDYIDGKPSIGTIIS